MMRIKMATTMTTIAAINPPIRPSTNKEQTIQKTMRNKENVKY
jgi:hypothetical protein